ncbi:hypothetical protein DFH29DRAFT_1069742 [Suillus ampliporus]|nr:hypothetical protein DFH29DRAFT_1069742 [Suillus ampliporus]
MATFAYKAHLAARSKTTSHHHSVPPPKQMEERVSPTFHPPVLARAHAHQAIHYQRDDSNTTAQNTVQVVNPPASNKFAGQGAHRARIFERSWYIDTLVLYLMSSTLFCFCTAFHNSLLFDAIFDVFTSFSTIHHTVLSNLPISEPGEIESAKETVADFRGDRRHGDLLLEILSTYFRHIEDIRKNSSPTDRARRPPPRLLRETVTYETVALSRAKRKYWQAHDSKKQWVLAPPGPRRTHWCGRISPQAQLIDIFPVISRLNRLLRKVLLLKYDLVGALGALGASCQICWVQPKIGSRSQLISDQDSFQTDLFGLGTETKS